MLKNDYSVRENYKYNYKTYRDYQSLVRKKIL